MFILAYKQIGHDTKLIIEQAELTEDTFLQFQEEYGSGYELVLADYPALHDAVVDSRYVKCGDITQPVDYVVKFDDYDGQVIHMYHPDVYKKVINNG